MDVNVSESPTQAAWCGIAGAKNVMLDKAMWNVSAHWTSDVKYLLTGIYDVEFLHSANKNLTRFDAPDVVDRLHIVRAPHREGDNIAFQLAHGSAVIATRNANIHIAGRESRRCTVVHLWRRRLGGEERGIVPIPSSESMQGGGCLARRRLDDQNDPHLRRHELIVGDNWTLLAYHGPIRAHPDERFQLDLKPGGAAFVLATVSDVVPLLTSWKIVPYSPTAASLVEPKPDEPMLFMERERVWALRFRAPYDDPLEVNNHLADKIRARRYADQLLMIQQNRTFRPMATIDPVQGIAQSDRHLVPESDFFRRMNQEPIPSPVEGLRFAVFGMGTEQAEIRGRFESDEKGSSPIWFIPLQQWPRVLAFVDSSTFFYLDVDPSLQRVMGLPGQLGVGGFRFDNPMAIVGSLGRLAQAHNLADTARILQSIFGTNGSMPVASMRLTHFRRSPPPSPADAHDDAMDLDPPVSG